MFSAACLSFDEWIVDAAGLTLVVGLSFEELIADVACLVVVVVVVVVVPVFSSCRGFPGKRDVDFLGPEWSLWDSVWLLLLEWLDIDMSAGGRLNLGM